MDWKTNRNRDAAVAAPGKGVALPDRGGGGVAGTWVSGLVTAARRGGMRRVKTRQDETRQVELAI